MNEKVSAPAINLADDVKAIEALIQSWKTAAPSGQLQIAIGALGTAIEYATHHINLPTAAAPSGGGALGVPDEASGTAREARALPVKTASPAVKAA